MSKKVLFQAIKKRLIDKVPEFSGIKNKSIAELGIRIFNRQDLNPEDHNVLPLRFILVEFSQTEWKPETRGTQKGTITVTVRIGFNSPNNDKLDESGFFDFEDNIVKALHGFDGEIFTTLQRAADRADEDFDHVYIQEIDFLTELTDTVASEDNDKIEGTITDITITKDLDIDNDVIRTGDGNV